jgi:CoA:oxalate CoA-transferase
VVKIEPPGGDKLRRRGPFLDDQPDPEKSLFFLYYNTNKKSVTLNLEHKDGQSLFREMIKRADAVVESFDVDYLASLGLGYQSLRQFNPGLVMCSINWFGHTGPCNNWKGCDLVAQSTSGYAQTVGEPEGPPIRAGNEQSIFSAGLYGAVGVLAALYGRDSVGHGQYIDVSSQEALISFYLDNGWALRYFLHGYNLTRLGRVSRHVVPNGMFPCKDG